MSWIDQLARIPNVDDVRPVDPEHVLIQIGGRRVHALVRRTARSPRPNELSQLAPPAEAPSLFVSSQLTDTARQVLERAGWWWADDDGAAIRTGGHWRRAVDGDSPVRDTWLRRRDSASGAAGSMARRVAYSDLAIVRVLLTRPGDWTQVALAECVGVSQPAISKGMARLRSRGLVTDSGDLGDATGALDWWLAHYPGPDGLTTHWYSLADPWATTTILVHAAQEEVAISGPVGADALAPWLPPDRVVLYSNAGLADPPTGLVPVANVKDAVATLVVTAQRDVFWSMPDARTSAPEGTPITLADPLQILWDLATAPTDDPSRRDEAAERLAGWILERRATR